MSVFNINLESIVKIIVVSSFAISVSACGGSGTSSSSAPQPDSGYATLQTQLVSLQNEVSALQNQVGSLQVTITALQASNSVLVNELNSDEIQLSKISLLGHQPSTSLLSIKGTSVIRSRVSGVTQTISYGPCTDMGVLIGTGQLDSLSTTTENFRQCTGYEYGAVVETGVITKPFELWFDGANCTGNMYEAGNDGGYNRQVLQDGVVFMSPIDGVTELMVAAGQQGTTTTLLSNFSSGSCNSGTIEIQTAYPVTPNELNITGVPSAVPANFIL